MGLGACTGGADEQYELLREQYDCEVGTDDHAVVDRGVLSSDDGPEDGGVFLSCGVCAAYPDRRGEGYAQPDLPEDHVAAVGLLL